MRLFGDLRYAFRSLRKTPGFTLIAMLSLALGIGANTAMFSFVDAVLLRPLPVKDSGAIVALHTTEPGSPLAAVSYPDYVDLREKTTAFQSLASWSFLSAAISAGRDSVPQMTVGYQVSGNFFSGLGIDIPVGRGFVPEEDRSGGKDQVVVISHSLWERYFNLDPGAVGR